MVLKLQSKSMLKDINDRQETKKKKTSNPTNKLLEDKIYFVFTFLHLTAAVMFGTVTFRDIIFDCHGSFSPLQKSNYSVYFNTILIQD